MKKNLKLAQEWLEKAKEAIDIADEIEKFVNDCIFRKF